MTDQYPGWGQPIKVDGKRPEWLGNHDPILYEHRSNERGKFGIGAHWHWKRHDWECVTSIRLPADDPRYQQEGPTKAERRFKPGDRVASALHNWDDCTVVNYIESHPFAGDVRVMSDSKGLGIIPEEHLEPIESAAPTGLERRFAAIVGDNERLRARVDELLAANNRLVGERRAVQDALRQSEADIANYRDMVDGLRHENGTAWAIVERQNKLLAEAAARFREYEKHHDERARAAITKALNASNKDDWWRQAKVAKESTEKAERNANMAMRLAAAIEPIQTEEEVKIIGIEGGKE